MKEPPQIAADSGNGRAAGAPRRTAEWDPLQALLQYVHRRLKERGKPATPAAPGPTISLTEFATRVAQWADAATGAIGAATALALDGGEIVCLGTSGVAPEVGTRLDRSAGISGRCVRSGEPQLCSDTADNVWADPRACAEMGVRSLAMVPLRKNGSIIGVLSVYSDRPGHFDRHHLGILRSLEGIVFEELECFAGGPETRAHAASK